MASKGKVRPHKDGRWYVDFGHDKRIWSMRIGNTDAKLQLTKELANRILALVQMRMAEGAGLDEAIAQFQPPDAKPNLVPAKLEEWLEVKRREVRAGDRSPTYLAELERYAADDGHFSWWSSRSVHEATKYALLEDWSAWLADRGLAPKSRFNVLAAFHAFLVWLYKREQIREMPRTYPWPKVPEPEPAVLSIAAQRAVLEAIPENRRGIFLAMALLGIRPGEAVALRASDLRDGWLTVSRARKGARLDSPVAGTKSGAVKRLPVPGELLEWSREWGGGVEGHAGARSRATPVRQLTAQAGTKVRPAPFPNLSAPLFPNPATGKPWAKSALRRTWEAACKKCGVRIGLYNGTKHTMATDAIARGVPERSLQAVLGHSNAKSTRRYARLADQALVEVLKRG